MALEYKKEMESALAAYEAKGNQQTSGKYISVREPRLTYFLRLVVF